MVKGNDTLPYKDSMEIIKDTEHFSRTFYPGDTLYHEPSSSFEKVNGQIINIVRNGCEYEGLWIIKDSSGGYRKGNYHTGRITGIWQRFDKNGKLLEETEEYPDGKNQVVVKEVDYSSGKPVVVINKPFMRFFLNNMYVIFVIFILALFSRVFINSKIYNVEDGTDYSPIYFYFPGFLSDNFGHSVQCMFSFWFSNYKPENRRRAIISNVLSVIALGIFFGLIIAFTIEGDMK
jgi:hypothetical protein